MEPMVSLRDVTKTYTRAGRAVPVLRNLDLDIGRGEFLALMGPSGSGKTSLLNLIGGLDRPTCGRIMVGDRRLDQMTSRELTAWRSTHVGFVFQFYNLMQALSAERNVELPLLLTSLSRAHRRAAVGAALQLVGVSERGRHRPSELSGGEQQRVAIARAIVAAPTLLVCDEPTGDLDRETADTILELLALLNQRHGTTIVMVTHDPMAAAYGTRRLHIDKGALVAPLEREAAA